jgi:hypothetical protein
MVRKVVSLVLAAFMLCGIFAGCNAVGEIAGNVADAAMKELENQVKATLEKNKVNVVELKTAIGKLNDEGSEMQFFCAALVKSDTDTVVNGAAEAMGAVFEKSGVLVQTGSKVESEYLVHKDITFKHSDFSDGTYYVIYVYISDMSIKLPELNLPTGK